LTPLLTIKPENQYVWFSISIFKSLDPLGLLSAIMASENARPIHAGPEDGWHGQVAPGTDFPPEAGRYHMYIGLFCPFAHRANLVRHLKGLTDIIDISVVRAYPKGDSKGWPGWKFPEDGIDEYPDATKDKLFGSKFLHEVYFKADAQYKGRYSVPAIWDRKTGTIVSNESSEIVRWMQTGFDELLPEAKRGDKFYPKRLRPLIDHHTKWIIRDLNTGVYKAGFAPDQATYDKNIVPVFAALNALEALVHQMGGPFILGDTLTELDILAYPTIVRFDVAYHQHFKCNLGSIRHDYPNLNEWLKNLYHNVPGFKDSTNFKHIKENYTKSHLDINPKGITPKGPYPDIERKPDLDFSKLRVGQIGMPEVLGYQKKIERGE